jgi:3-hydroxyacyl-[acyl-carrier-protein] dehydratase
MDSKNSDITNILPQRYPFLMIDRVVEYVPGEKVVCIKNVSVNEPHFMGHFPDYPIMPGVLIIEAAAQSGIVLFSNETAGQAVSKRDYLLSSVKANFMKPVVPGDQLILTVVPVKMLSDAAVMKVACTVAGETVAKCEFVFAARITNRE